MANGATAAATGWSFTRRKQRRPVAAKKVAGDMSREEAEAQLVLGTAEKER
jgi:hypothetical protein